MKEKPVEKIDDSCQTKYPLLMIHGLGFRDDNPFYNYWGRIPTALKARGATIYYGGQDAWGAIEGNTDIILRTIKTIKEKDGVEKFNIIAHSKGGLEARYIISTLGLADSVASLTTISTPHHGLKTVDFIFSFPKFLLKITAFFVNLWFNVLGDRKPDFYNSLAQLTTQNAAAFNQANPNKDGILYQSYSAKMKNSFSDLVFFFTHPCVKFFDGENDGMVSVESAKWGEWLGTIENTKNRGMSHSDIVDVWRHNIRGCDIREYYIKTVQALKEKGL